MKLESPQQFEIDVKQLITICHLSSSVIYVLTSLDLHSKYLSLQVDTSNDRSITASLPEESTSIKTLKLNNNNSFIFFPSSYFLMFSINRNNQEREHGPEPVDESTTLNPSSSHKRSSTQNLNMKDTNSVNSKNLRMLPKFALLSYVCFYGCLLFFLIVYRNNNNSGASSDDEEAITVADIANHSSKGSLNNVLSKMNENILGSSNSNSDSSSNNNIGIITQEMQVLESASFHMSHNTKTKCFEDKHYSMNTAKTAFELPFAALFKDTRGEKKFEASSLIKVCVLNHIMEVLNFRFETYL